MELTEAWLQVLTVVGSNLIIILTFFGITISLHNGIRSDLLAIREEIKESRQEMRDFHGRLEKQDAEFKAHMMYHHTHRIIKE